MSSLGVEIQVVRPAESLGESDNAGGSEHDGSNNVHDHFDVRIDLRDEWTVDGLGVEDAGDDELFAYVGEGRAPVCCVMHVHSRG